MALGKPSRIVTRKTADAAQEVWVYGASEKSHVGFGFGLGTGGSSFYGGGVGVGLEANPPHDYFLRVVFQNGAVVSVEDGRPQPQS